ncbi:hypothetical protein CNMCM8686_001078 [Aspergillus fumigatus]|nr:hypothetical protein CNMCM8686_001078 [Aspergillus fumigatus]
MWSLNYTFDGSFYPLFPTLATGRTLCIAPQNTIVSNLTDVITKLRVNQINLTPTMASLLHPDDVLTLEILATGGEPITHHMLNVWAPRIKVYTSYGPTEATICVTTQQVTPDMNIRNVGRPFPNTTALILDPDTMEELLSGSTHLLQNHSFNFPSTVIEPKLSSTEIAKINASLDINGLASSTRVTAPIVFQTAYSLLLAHLSGARDVIYDNLVTGQNIALDNPQLINGNCANFLPYHSYVADDIPIKTLLQSTQADFWTSTENSLVSLSEIYEALGRDQSTAAAKYLFCFQPFEPVTAQQDPMHWVVMKMSKNRMTFNYAIQIEVIKAAAKGKYLVRFGYDERAFSAEEAQAALAWYTQCLDGMVKSKVVRELGV